MIQIGKYKLGFAAFSTLIIFIVLSLCAIVAAFHKAAPDYALPLRDIILINEGMALLATLIYGIFAHFAIVIIDKIRRNRINDKQS